MLRRTLELPCRIDGFYWHCFWPTWRAVNTCKTICVANPLLLARDQSGQYVCAVLMWWTVLCMGGWTFAWSWEPGNANELLYKLVEIRIWAESRICQYTLYLFLTSNSAIERSVIQSIRRSRRTSTEYRYVVLVQVVHSDDWLTDIINHKAPWESSTKT